MWWGRGLSCKKEKFLLISLLTKNPDFNYYRKHVESIAEIYSEKKRKQLLHSVIKLEEVKNRGYDLHRNLVPFKNPEEEFKSSFIIDKC